MGSPHHGRQPLGGFGQKNSAAAAPYSPIHIELTRDLLRQSLINHVNCSWAQDRWLFSSLSHPPRKQGNLWWTLHQRVCVRDAPNRVLWWGAPTTGDSLWEVSVKRIVLLLHHIHPFISNSANCFGRGMAIGDIHCSKQSFCG